MTSSHGRGRRTEPHTADVIVEAWGPDTATCAEEAVRGLLEVCVAGDGVDARDGATMWTAAGSTTAMLEAVLEDLIYVFDTSDRVPIDASVRDSSDGGLEMRTRVVPPDAVRLTGPAPKAIVMLSVETGDMGTRCRFIVDV